MMLGTYQRVEWHAGGVYAPARKMIRALRQKLLPEALKHHNRHARHKLIREMLEMQEVAQQVRQRWKF
jgi:hypothetical protein